MKISKEDLQKQIDDFRNATPPKDYQMTAIKNPITGELYAEIEVSQQTQEARETKLKQQQKKVINELITDLQNSDWNQ